LCGVHLPKLFGIYDWATRPLDQEPLRYALDDVVWLPRVSKAIEKLVQESDLEEELAIANLAVAEVTHSELSTDTSEAMEARIYSIKGAGTLSKPELRVLLLLFMWRDKEALRHNTAPANVILNHKLIQIAKATLMRREKNPEEGEEEKKRGLVEAGSSVVDSSSNEGEASASRQVEANCSTEGDKVEVEGRGEEPTQQESTTVVASEGGSMEKESKEKEVEEKSALPEIVVVEIEDNTRRDIESGGGDVSKPSDLGEKVEWAVVASSREMGMGEGPRTPQPRVLSAKKGGRRRRWKSLPASPLKGPLPATTAKAATQKGVVPLSAEEMEDLKNLILRILGQDQGYFADVMRCVEEAWKNPPRLPKKKKDHRGLPVLKKLPNETKEKFAARLKKMRDDIRYRELALKKWRTQEAARRGVPLQVVLPIRALNYLRLNGIEPKQQPQPPLQHSFNNNTEPPQQPLPPKVFCWDDVPQLGPKRARLYGEMLRRICEDPFIIEGIERKEDKEKEKEKEAVGGEGTGEKEYDSTAKENKGGSGNAHGKGRQPNTPTKAGEKKPTPKKRPPRNNKATSTTEEKETQTPPPPTESSIVVAVDGQEEAQAGNPQRQGSEGGSQDSAS